MNKTGKAGQTYLLFLATIIAIALVGVAVMFATGGFSQSIINGGTPAGGAGCSVTPSFSNTGIDALVSNSNVTPANFAYVVNGVYKGSSYSPSYGDEVTVLTNPTGYLADVKTVKVGCDVNQVPFQYYSYANATVTVKNDAGTAVLTSGGGANNETQMTTSKNNEITFVVPSQKSTGKIFVYLEMPSASASNMSSTQLSCNGVAVNAVANIPSFITSTNTNAYRSAWEIAPIQNGNKVTCNLQQSLLASKTLQGFVRMTFYGEEQFVDTDGTVKTGIYDSLGTAKYQDSYGYSWYVASA